MTQLLWIVGGLLLAFFAFFFAWRVASNYFTLPCPSGLGWMLEGSLVDWWAGTEKTLDRMQIAPGQTILEIGPGPGRLLVPASFRVLPGGRAIGIDIQPKMIAKVEARAKREGVTNLTTMVGDATKLELADASVDLVYLCTVLGEIPDRTAAVRECFRVLKPGGWLSITEIMGDPHYQSRGKVQHLAEEAGFALERIDGGTWMFTANFAKS
ncbi:MAG: methyltransferase domain-containing protein [Planctomycetota bacterium]|mgnify:CR=1 FL=1|nr:MAG: methyltransferase domain-containing protein [Planctomycetota bacterium]